MRAPAPTARGGRPTLPNRSSQPPRWSDRPRLPLRPCSPPRPWFALTGQTSTHRFSTPVENRIVSVPLLPVARFLAGCLREGARLAGALVNWQEEKCDHGEHAKIPAEI